MGNKLILPIYIGPVTNVAGGIASSLLIYKRLDLSFAAATAIGGYAATAGTSWGLAMYDKSGDSNKQQMYLNLAILANALAAAAVSMKYTNDSTMAAETGAIFGALLGLGIYNPEIRNLVVNFNEKV